MVVREIRVKSILSKSKVYEYVVNPYIGCEHACTYCYARFMKRFTGHREPWGEFVDVKVNAPELLEAEVGKKKKGWVWISGVCDPYQPLEAKYGLTRKCLEILVQGGWPVVVQTRSPLVLRDADILGQAVDLEVGFSIGTADDAVRKLFEPNAPPIEARVDALGRLHRMGVRTYAMIAPMLPGAGRLPDMLEGKVDYLIVDRMNYGHADWVYRTHGLQASATDEFFHREGGEIASSCRRLGIECRMVC